MFRVPPWGRIASNDSYTKEKSLDPWPRAGLERLTATLLASWRLTFYHRFFDAFLGRFWLRFPSQFASQNRPKSIKNQCQDVIQFGPCFLIE